MPQCITRPPRHKHIKTQHMKHCQTEQGHIYHTSMRTCTQTHRTLASTSNTKRIHATDYKPCLYMCACVRVCLCMLPHVLYLCACACMLVHACVLVHVCLCMLVRNVHVPSCVPSLQAPCLEMPENRRLQKGHMYCMKSSCFANWNQE